MVWCLWFFLNYIGFIKKVLNKEIGKYLNFRVSIYVYVIFFFIKVWYKILFLKKFKLDLMVWLVLIYYFNYGFF